MQFFKYIYTNIYVAKAYQCWEWKSPDRSWLQNGLECDQTDHWSVSSSPGNDSYPDTAPGGSGESPRAVHSSG